MVGRLLGRFGDILGSVVAAILQLALTIVIGPIVLLLIGTDAALSIARREPRITLPSSVTYAEPSAAVRVTTAAPIDSR